MSKTTFETQPCPSIDPLDVNAYFELSLDPVDTQLLKLDTSWGCTAVDLAPALHLGETITHLFLTPEDNPTSLQYNREDYGIDGAPNGGVDCITGNELSRIISLRLLRDVSQTKVVKDGDMLVWNGVTELFEPYNIMDFIKQTNITLERHEGDISMLQSTVTTIQNDVTDLKRRVTNVENRLDAVETDLTALKQRVTNLETTMGDVLNRLTRIEALLERPAGVPTNTRLVWGNINYLSDYTNSNNYNWGLYTHNPNSLIPNDAYDA